MKATINIDLGYDVRESNISTSIQAFENAVKMQVNSETNNAYKNVPKEIADRHGQLPKISFTYSDYIKARESFVTKKNIINYNPSNDMIHLRRIWNDGEIWKMYEREKVDEDLINTLTSIPENIRTPDESFIIQNYNNY